MGGNIRSGVGQRGRPVRTQHQHLHLDRSRQLLAQVGQERDRLGGRLHRGLPPRLFQARVRGPQSGRADNADPLGRRCSIDRTDEPGDALRGLVAPYVARHARAFVEQQPGDDQL